MNEMTIEFAAAQRRTLYRYAEFLKLLPSTFDRIAIVLERCRGSGHQVADLAADSRLKNATFNERSVQGLWGQVDEIKWLCNSCARDLEIICHECRALVAQTSRREPVANVDFSLFSSSRLPWKLQSPRNVPDLVHELNLRFYSLGSAVMQLKFVIAEVFRESIGLKSLFTKAMGHRSCMCHADSTVLDELFRHADTTPIWDIVYSSPAASIRAYEYRLDTAVLFEQFASVALQMLIRTQELYQWIDSVILELTQATYAPTLGMLNLRLKMTMERAVQARAITNDFELWLRK